MSQCLDHSLSIDTTTSTLSADCTPVPSIDTATAPIMDQTLLDAKSPLKGKLYHTLLRISCNDAIIMLQHFNMLHCNVFIYVQTAVYSLINTEGNYFQLFSLKPSVVP